LATALKVARSDFSGLGQSIEHVATGEIDGRGLVEIQIDVGTLGGDDGVDHARHVTTSEVVGFEPAGGNAILGVGSDSCLHGHDLAIDDDSGIHLPQPHADEAPHAHPGVGHEGLQPEFEVQENYHGHKQ
jgi:hypothetical protein